MVALDLDLAVSRRPAGTASLLQRRRQLRKRRSRHLESARDRHALPRPSLAIDDHANGLFRRLLIRLRINRALLTQPLRSLRIAGPDEA